MAGSIVKALLDSKVAGATKEIEGMYRAFKLLLSSCCYQSEQGLIILLLSTGALDDRQSKAHCKATVKKEIQERHDAREREKMESHRQREIERENIRAKYQLPKKTNKSKSRKTSDKCTIS